MRYLLFLPLLFSLAFAQNTNLKHDYVWQTGFPNQNVRIDFSQSPPLVTAITNSIGMDNSGTCISNRAGQLQLISNGYTIADAQNNIVATGLSPDDKNYPTIGGMPLIRATTWVEDPADSNRYYFLHASSNFHYFNDSTYVIGIETLYYTHVGKDPMGNWQVLTINQPLLSYQPDSLNIIAGTTSVCRHANGRDWWLLAFEVWTKRYCRFLISPQGVQNMGWIGEQGVYDPTFIGGGGGGHFSPAGDRFELRTDSSVSYLWDFDRCNGVLSQERRWDLRGDSVIYNATMREFSPNGRFWYDTDMTIAKVRQWDLNYSDPVKNRPHIATASTNTVYGTPQLAPDGKIYFATGTPFLHAIINPDSLGVACVPQENYLAIPTLIGTLPQFPNYRLGALKGSGCDTLSTSVEKPMASKQQVRVYPNPARDEVVFTTPSPSYPYGQEGSVVNPLLGGAGVGEVVLHDLLGREVLRKVPRADTALSGVSSVTLDISPLPNGIYLWHCAGQSGKLVISR